MIPGYKSRFCTNICMFFFMYISSCILSHMSLPSTQMNHLNKHETSLHYSNRIRWTGHASWDLYTTKIRAQKLIKLGKNNSRSTERSKRKTSISSSPHSDWQVSPNRTSHLMAIPIQPNTTDARTIPGVPADHLQAKTRLRLHH